MPTSDSLVDMLGKALRRAEWQYDEEYETNRCAGCEAGDFNLSIHIIGCEIAAALTAWEQSKVKK